MTNDSAPVLLCYDGSDNARHAVREARCLVRGDSAVVLHVWSWQFGQLLHEEEVEREQRKITEQGLALAREVGFDAVAETVYGASLWPAIVKYAEEHAAQVVVLGTSGTSNLASVLGSVAYGVAHHCTRPVLLIRPPE